MGILGRFNQRKNRESHLLLRPPQPVKHQLVAASARGATIPLAYYRRHRHRHHNQRIIRHHHNFASLSAMRESTKTNVPAASNDTKNGNKSAPSTSKSKNNDGKIKLHSKTESIIKQEIIDLLYSSQGHSCTVLEIAQTLADSQQCIDSHGKTTEVQSGIVASLKSWTKELTANSTNKRKRKHKTFQFPSLKAFIPSSQLEKAAIQRRYDLMNVLNELEKNPASRSHVVKSWDEAKQALADVFIFPSDDDEEEEEENNNNENKHENGEQPVSKSDHTTIAKKYETKLDLELATIQDSVDAMSLSTKWKRISEYPTPPPLGKTKEDQQEEESIETLLRRQSIDKVDLLFNARLQDAKELELAFRQKDSIKKLEERIKLEEAKKRASSLMRSLTEEERQIIHDAVYDDYSPDEEIIAQSGPDTVQRKSMRTLRPGQWLNDEIIHYFLLMLAKRDEDLCKQNPDRKPSHFFKSFFMTKLLNEGSATCDGEYEYRNVKRWSKKVPGKDIFGLDKIIFPINQGNMHWICAVVFMKEKRIQVYDSMGQACHRYLEVLLQYLEDEHMDKKKKALPDAESWELVPTQPDTPRQRNGYDCGVFTCMVADFVSKDTALVFNQNHVNQCRDRIALSIMNGKAIM